MTIVLGFDTSGPHCGAALFAGGDVVAALYENIARGQAERLMPMLEEVLAEAGMGWSDLDRIGVGVGPGNFTGIRISVSAARGLSLALDIPAVGVSIMEAAALGTDGPRLIALSAPRDTAYVQGFGGAKPEELQQVALADLSDDLMQPGLVCIGSAGAAVAERLGAEHVPAMFAPASGVARIAALGEADRADRPSPIYFRAADATPTTDPPPVILP